MAETEKVTTITAQDTPPSPALLDAAATALVQSCEVQLGVDLESAWAPTAPGRTPELCGAAIDLGTNGGAWRLYVFCPRGTAARLARIMFDLTEDEEPEAEDLEDCLCEVVNISAGHLKSLDGEVAALELRLPGFLVPDDRPAGLVLDTEERARRLCSGDDIELMTTLVWHEEA